MSKRTLSPATFPSAKRAHTSNASSHSSKPLPSFDSLLYDELVLHIFSYLTAPELCTIQSCNRHWARLALDDQLWKDLFLDNFGKARLRGSRGFTRRQDGRPIKPLRDKIMEQRRSDWKWMYRISSNWRSGRCEIETLKLGYDIADDDINESRQVEILIAGDMIVASSLGSRHEPSLVVHSPSCPTQTIRSEKLQAGQLGKITCLVQDQSAPSSSVEGDIKLAVFYATGAISIFFVSSRAPASSCEKDVYIPILPSERTSPITMAAYHHPLLVTLSQSFHLSTYHVDHGNILHRQTLSSFASYPPNSLVLSSPNSHSFKLLVAYSVPIYPDHWGVSTTELTISSTSSTVSSSRTRRAFDIPMGWVDETKLKAVREQWSRKVTCVMATQTDGKWVVFAGSDNAIQVYRLYNRPSPGQLVFVRSLHGHPGRIHSIALADGRCVSVGEDGSVWVWDLELEWGVEVKGGQEGVRLAGHVVFDERRILCAHEDELQISRFDI